MDEENLDDIQLGEWEEPQENVEPEDVDDSGNPEPEDGPEDDADAPEEDSPKEDKNNLQKAQGAKDKDFYKDKASRARKREREYRKALDDLKAENEKLRTMTARADEAATIISEQGIKTSIELAKRKLRESMETNDVDSHIEAQEEIGNLTARLYEIQKHNINQKYAAEEQMRQMPKEQEERINAAPEAYDPEYDENEYRADFIERHSFVNPSSFDYDHELAEEIDIAARKLNHDLKKTGREHLLYSKAYFKKLDDYVERNIKRMSQNKSYSKGPIKKTFSGSSPVRSGYGNVQSRKINLTDEQKEMAEFSGMTEEQFIEQIRATQVEANKLKRMEQ